MNRETVEEITAALMLMIKAHLETEPRNEDQVLEVLNALGVVAGVVLAGTGSDPKAIEFFRSAVNGQLGHVESAVQKATDAPGTWFRGAMPGENN